MPARVPRVPAGAPVAVAAAAAAAGVAVAAAVRPPSPKCAGECPPLPLSTDRPDKAVDAHRAAGLKTEPLPQWAFRRVTDGGRNELVRLRAKLSEARKAAERQRLWPGEAGFWAIPTAGPRRITPFHQTAR